MFEDIHAKIIVPERADPEGLDIDAILVQLTEQLDRRGIAEAVHGCLGGEYGYGAYYENDVFMMHPFCWCEREECPWCGGCRVDYGDPDHTPQCYQSRVNADLLEAGFVQPQWASYPHPVAPKGWSWRRGQEVEDRVHRQWCEHFGLPFPHGCWLHCTCGAREAWLCRVRACTCEYCAATGIFAQHGAEPGRGAPNFWHKPSGLKVWWYKWIGRDTEVYNPGGVSHLDVYAECIQSLPESGEGMHGR